MFSKSTLSYKILSLLFPSFALFTVFNDGVLKYLNATSVWQTRTVLNKNKNDDSKRVEFQIQDVGALGYNKRTVEVQHITNFLMKIDTLPSSTSNSEESVVDYRTK